MTLSDPMILKTFEKADEVRKFEKGRFELVRLGGMVIGRATYEPGWKWSEHVGKATGAVWCDVEHVGLVTSGKAAVLMRDGTERVIAAGTVFHIAAGHDSWVVGSEPYVSIHLMGADSYARKER
ncbi:MAG TPA: cupin domain-containing protein [Thermoanaerobaculia bacterium]|nr:cupin domain-containing protein [Thermoanaerobaculia bacterium]